MSEAPSNDDGKVTTLDDQRRRKARARVRIAAAATVTPAMKPGGAYMGVAPGAWREKHADEFGMPTQCPVKPLGRDGSNFYFLNVFGGVQSLNPKSGRGDIAALFSGAKYFPCWAWPKKGKRTGEEFDPNFNADLARDDLMEAASLKQRRTQMNVHDAIRGRGCWPGPDGGLYVHVGNRVIAPGGEILEPFSDADHVYPMRPPIGGPATEAAIGGTDGPGAQLLADFQSWRWARPDIDPYLLLGWVGSAFLGPALHWRPVVYAVGDAGTGKSDLGKLVKAVLGRWAILTTNATAPSIYRELNGDGLAVMNDEAEGERDGRRGQALIRLAREAASGAMTMRASGDGADKFTVRSSFFFSAINMTSLGPQDYSRMAILMLRPFETPGRSPLDERLHGLIGAQLLRRLIDRYDRVVAAVEAFRGALIGAGHDGRGGDTFGTLAGVAHVMLHDDAPDAALLADWAQRLAAAKLIELEGKRPNWEACLDQLLAAQPDCYRTFAAKSVGALLMHARKLKDPEILSIDDVRDRLALVGLGLLMRGRGKDWANAWLFVPSGHPQTRLLFRDTKWEGEPGEPGTWATALRGGPSDAVDQGQVKGTVSGRKVSGVAIRIDAILQQDEEDER